MCRLTYSIAIQVPFDILLLDEVLAVGDESFSHQKCFATFEKMREHGKTVVYVSYGLETVARSFDRALFFQVGEIHAIGRPDEVIDVHRRREVLSLTG
jgi:ABC-type polysaccharide/polyol phosphate transport system ATPase subunit